MGEEGVENENSQGGENWEKLRQIMQNCVILYFRKITRNWVFAAGGAGGEGRRETGSWKVTESTPFSGNAFHDQSNLI